MYIRSDIFCSLSSEGASVYVDEAVARTCCEISDKRRFVLWSEMFVINRIKHITVKLDISESMLKMVLSMKRYFTARQVMSISIA